MVPSGKVEAITSQALRNIRVPDYHEYVPFVVVPTQSRTSFLVYDSSLNITYNPNSNMSTRLVAPVEQELVTCPSPKVVFKLRNLSFSAWLFVDHW
jgi:hypothetical protein